MFATTICLLPHFSGSQQLSIQASTAACREDADGARPIYMKSTMQTNITHYEDMMQLEDDILCFLPTVSDIDVFGCEVDLIDFATQLPLPAFHTALMQKRKLQIVVHGRRPPNLAIPKVWKMELFKCLGARSNFCTWPHRPNWKTRFKTDCRVRNAASFSRIAELLLQKLLEGQGNVW